MPHELLIVDDGSSPALSVLPDLRVLLRRPDVRLLRVETNRGLTFALNFGLAEAGYDWIARIDADDFWRAGKLRIQLEALAADPDLTLIATSMRLVHAHEPSLDRDDVRGGRWEQMPELVERRHCPIPHGSILARKDVFGALGGYPTDPRFKHCEDFALWAAWMRFFKFVVLDDVLFEYSFSEGQISSRFADQQRRASTLVLESLANLGDYGRIPGAIEEISRALDLSLLDTSKLLCTAWKFFNDILVDSPLEAAVRSVFPDRQVHRSSPDPPPERMFHLCRGASSLKYIGERYTVDTLAPLWRR